ncbi:hypothetical protein CcaverHIS002_0607380 [Cutaneotrichosporon cavernicola]|nr:hypothetical protein CcaverHIS002_0607380 [Cutaneotrichosporon cavernicola]
MSTKSALTAAWAALHTFQYGFAISAMNGIQAVVVSFAILLGSTALAVANSVFLMVLARVVVGLGCGLATTTVPLVLADLAPPGSKKALGIANQLFIVLGILVAQTLSFPFGRAGVWRVVPATAAAVALVQLLGSLLVRLPGDLPSSAPGEEPLLGGAPRSRPEVPLTITELLSSRDPEVTRGLPLVLATQFFQQTTGPSVVMYFSTAILSAVIPGSAKAIALAIVIVKVPITISPAFLIERVGTRPLLILPTCFMVGAMLALASGLNSEGGTLAVAGMVGFVAAFSVGLGPVTWVVLGEVMPPYARPAASAVGLAVNWSTNFVVGAAFLPLQAKLGGRDHPGNIFYIFAGSCAAAVLAIRWGYRVYEAR